MTDDRPRPDPGAPPAATSAPRSGGTRGLRSGGFALAVTGLAGLLFHLNEGVPILESRLGQISLGLIALGILLLVAGLFLHARPALPPPEPPPPDR